MKTAIITGASRGIGHEIARVLSKSGYAVMINCKESLDKAVSLADEIRASGGSAEVMKADISVPEEAKSLVGRTVETLGEPDLLVNNAGVALWGLFTDASDKEIEKVISTDLTGAMILSRECAKYMIKRKEGVIINVASMWGEIGASCEVVYSAAKAGIIGFTKALAKELAPSGIRVNCVSPGIIDTEMMARFSTDEIKSLRDDIPLGRLGTPRDVASAVAFLASDEASYITGQTLSVNGGSVV